MQHVRIQYINLDLTIIIFVLTQAHIIIIIYNQYF